jgi:hypothetical protein
MTRFIAPFVALAFAVPVLLLPSPSRGSAGALPLPMHFSLRLQGPADTCGGACRVLVEANGVITADTPEDFETFAREHNLAGALVVLDSLGGSVHGAIALGRDIRRLGLDTTVGRIETLKDRRRAPPRAKVLPDADCESMCAFVLIAGVHRTVPPEARVMVHQIWLGDRRDDPTAASYSAEDLVLVQRDIGRLAKYTSDMGANIELLDLALRIPPWEPMYTLTRADIDRTQVATGAAIKSVEATAAAKPAPVAQSLPSATDGVRAIKISERGWAVVERDGSAVLARRHPLTVEGEDIGSFDLLVACGPTGKSYQVEYVERRHDGRHIKLPAHLDAVTMAAGDSLAKLKVVSSLRQVEPDELVTRASGDVPVELIGGFAGTGSHSMMITTESAGTETAIRLGNTGAEQNLPRLAAVCRKALGARAALSRPGVGGLASAK